MGKRDIVAGLMLLLFSIVVGAVALTYGYKAEYGPGPGFIPFWLSVVLGGLGLLLAANGLAEHRKGSAELDEDLLMFTNPKAFFSALGTLLAVAALIEHLGFVITIGFATTIFVRLVKADHAWSKALMIGFITSIVMFVFFNYLLGIVLPKGVLPI